MITVRISKHELATIPTERVTHGAGKLATPRETERHILTRLRNAGIPVLGETFLVALDHGELTIRKDWDGAYVYVWKGV